MNFKKIRLELGLSQEKWAAKLGVSLGTVRGWEYGRKPSPMAMERIKKFLKEIGYEKPGHSLSDIRLRMRE